MWGKIKILLLVIVMPMGISAQQTPITDNYIITPLTINPAYAGNVGALSLAAFYRYQWVGIKGAPATMAITMDSPVRNEKIGLGVIISNNKIGVSSETRFISNYSYKIHWGKGDLSFGLGAGIVATNTAWSDLLASDAGDEDILVDSKIYAIPQVSFGALYTHKDFFAGFSMPGMVHYTFNPDNNNYDLLFELNRLNYMVLAGASIRVLQDFKLQPSVLLSIVSDKKILYDLNAYAYFSERFATGLSYRNNRSVAGLFQLQISNQLKVAYSYNFDIKKMGKYNLGSHEIMLRYDLRYKIDVVNPLQF